MKLLRALELFRRMEFYGARTMRDLASILEGPRVKALPTSENRPMPRLIALGVIDEFPYEGDLWHIVHMLEAVLEGYGDSGDGLACDDDEMANDAQAVVDQIRAYLLK